MPKAVKKHPNESFDAVMRRFKKSVERDDLMNTIREKEFFEKPAQRRKKAKAAAVSRARKANQVEAGRRDRKY